MPNTSKHNDFLSFFHFWSWYVIIQIDYRLHFKDLKSVSLIFEVHLKCACLSKISTIPRPWFREMLMDQDDGAFISALRAVAAHYRRCAQQQALGPGIFWVKPERGHLDIPKTNQRTRWFDHSSTNLLVIHLSRETLDSFGESDPGGWGRKSMVCWLKSGEIC